MERRALAWRHGLLITERGRPDGHPATGAPPRTATTRSAGPGPSGAPGRRVRGLTREFGGASWTSWTWTSPPVSSWR
jgi:hypothetical protein